MSTTLKLSQTRFVRRVNSGQVTNTQWLAGMASIADQVKTADWAKSSVSQAVLPVNVPDTSDFSSDTYDCFKQSGNAIKNTGTQCVFAGMAIYRIKRPTSASSTYISSVSFRATADKFCVGGLKIAAILSNSATPPTDWSILRTGGYGDTIDVTGAFSTVGTVDSGSTEITGILAETSALVSNSTSHVDDFVLNLSSVTASYSYLYLAISLFDYETYRREYWVEGSGAIDGESIAVTFNSTVIADAEYVLWARARHEYSADVTSALTIPNYDSFNAYSQTKVIVNTELGKKSYALSAGGIRYLISQELGRGTHQPADSDLLYISNILEGSTVGLGLYVAAEPLASVIWSRFWLRSTLTNGETATGISFSQSVPYGAFVPGLVYRLSIYGHEGTIGPILFTPPSTYISPNILSLESSYDLSLRMGSATSAKLGYTSTVDTKVASDSDLAGTLDVPLKPLAKFDLSGSNIQSGTILKFDTPWLMPKRVSIFCCLSLIGVDSTYVDRAYDPIATTGELNATFKYPDLAIHLV